MRQQFKALKKEKSAGVNNRVAELVKAGGEVKIEADITLQQDLEGMGLVDHMNATTGYYTTKDR